MFEEDMEECEILVQLPQNPLPDDEETFAVTLGEPKGYNAKLGEENSCDITVINSLGE